MVEHTCLAYTALHVYSPAHTCMHAHVHANRNATSIPLYLHPLRNPPHWTPAGISSYLGKSLLHSHLVCKSCPFFPIHSTQICLSALLSSLKLVSTDFYTALRCHRTKYENNSWHTLSLCRFCWLIGWLLLFFFSETKSHYVGQAAFELVVSLPLSPKCWDYRCMAHQGQDSVALPSHS